VGWGRWAALVVLLGLNRDSRGRRGGLSALGCFSWHGDRQGNPPSHAVLPCPRARWSVCALSPVHLVHCNTTVAGLTAHRLAPHFCNLKSIPHLTSSTDVLGGRVAHVVQTVWILDSPLVLSDGLGITVNFGYWTPTHCTTNPLTVDALLPGHAEQYNASDSVHQRVSWRLPYNPLPPACRCRSPLARPSSLVVDLRLTDGLTGPRPSRHCLRIGSCSSC
jgi:hypothetical protein